MKHVGKITTIEKAMNSNAPTIGTFQREKGRDFTEALIMGWLVYLNTLMDLKNPMSEEQIELCAQNIVDEFYGLKISDITLLFKRIISGQHGKFYERLSIADILSFFREYFNERCEVAEQNSDRMHKDFSSNETFNYSNNIRRIFETGAKKSGK